ncbi:MAG: hypothetical protein KatS3mg119_2031 [Rhodothalassiaceae bacterium]|nr:MAG: hypothetical protein KatS3mg119_2031 [Rhodothalassiaceae bacterium]
MRDPGEGAGAGAKKRRSAQTRTAPGPGEDAGHARAAAWQRVMAGLAPGWLLRRLARLRLSERIVVAAFGVLALLEAGLGVRKLALGWSEGELPWLEIIIGGNAVLVGLLAVGVLLRERLAHRLLGRSRALADHRLAFLDRFTQQLRMALEEAPDALRELDEIGRFLVRSLDRFLVFSWAGLWRVAGDGLEPIALVAGGRRKAPFSVAPTLPFPPDLAMLRQRHGLGLDDEAMARLAEAGLPPARSGYAAGVHLDGKLVAVLIVARRNMGASRFDDGERAFLAAITRSIMLGLQAAQIARLRRDLQEALRRMERAQRVQAEFLSELSHELRTPLNAIIGFGEMLTAEDAPPEEKRREYVHHMVAAARSLLAMLEELLTISDQPDLGVPEDVVAVDPVKVAAATVPRLRATAGRHAVAFAVDEAVEEDGGGAARRIHVDPRWLRQAILAAGFWAISAVGEGGAVRMRLAANHGRMRLAFELGCRDRNARDRILAQEAKPDFSEDAFVARGRRLTSPLNFARALVEAQGGIVTLAPRGDDGAVLTLSFSC